MRTIILALMLLLVGTAAGASAYKDFVKLWDGRDKAYRAEREALDMRAKGSADRAVEAMVTGSSTAGEDLEMALMSTWSLSELVGRGQTLWELREHMAAKPSMALSEAWLHGKVDELRRKEADADIVEHQIAILRDRDTTSVQQWIGALERLTMIRAGIAGSAAELELISRNLGSYYRAREEEGPAQGAVIRSVLLGIAASVASSQAQTQSRGKACARSPGGCGR